MDVYVRLLACFCMWGEIGVCKMGVGVACELHRDRFSSL